jgi:hypothetical protein
MLNDRKKENNRMDTHVIYGIVCSFRLCCSFTRLCPSNLTWWPLQELARRRKKIPESDYTDGKEGLK